MKILEIWTSVVNVEFSFIGSSVVARFETKPCAQHCLSWMKANPAFVVSKFGGSWSCQYGNKALSLCKEADE